MATALPDWINYAIAAVTTLIVLGVGVAIYSRKRKAVTEKIIFNFF
jgi:hypothetical protein